MRIILAGIIGRYPWGGVTWCSLMYLLGLRDLGHDVYYLEDTCECNYDPEINAIATDPKYALNYIHESLRPFGLGDRWCYVDYNGNHHGHDEGKWKSICASTDLMLVLSGGCWVWRDHYLTIPVKAYIDSDPAFTQLAIHRAVQNHEADERKNWYVNYFRAYNRLFTFGNNIGTSRCQIPTSGLEWKHTWQPIVMDSWTIPGDAPAPRREWTTVMTWQIESFQDIGGNKDQEFLKILDLPNRLQQGNGPEIELAVSGPMDLLRQHGWRCVDAFERSSDLWKYRDFIQNSRGEFSVAKHTYVNSRCGWFSDRTECYLASGRPAVVQDTGFTDVLPTGQGLFAWTSLDEALECLLAVEADYEKHGDWAGEVAREYFSSSIVLPELLRQCEREGSNHRAPQSG